MIYVFGQAVESVHSSLFWVLTHCKVFPIQSYLKMSQFTEIADSTGNRKYSNNFHNSFSMFASIKNVSLLTTTHTVVVKAIQVFIEEPCFNFFLWTTFLWFVVHMS